MAEKVVSTPRAGILPVALLLRSLPLLLGSLPDVLLLSSLQKGRFIVLRFLFCRETVWQHYYHHLRRYRNGPTCVWRKHVLPRSVAAILVETCVSFHSFCFTTGTRDPGRKVGGRAHRFSPRSVCVLAKSVTRLLFVIIIIMRARRNHHNRVRRASNKQGTRKAATTVVMMMSQEPPCLPLLVGNDMS